MEDNTPRRVVGLKYEAGEGLPQVVAKAAGPAADALLSRALYGGPPVVSDPALATQLYRLPMDAHIGPELFELVAAVLAHVLLMDQQNGQPL